MLPEGYKILVPESEKDFEIYYRLRWEVLRAPWNQPQGSERDDLESIARHILIKDESGNAAGCGRIQFNDENTAQIRYMAVRSDLQGKGIGKSVMQELEKVANEGRRYHIILQAREDAVEFYKSCGYSVSEKTFLLYDSIQHYQMEKFLQPEH